MSRRPTDETGNRYGRLVVLSYAGRAPHGNGNYLATWLCRCDCGQETVVRGSSLRDGKTRSCGCLQAQTNTRRLHAAWWRWRNGLGPNPAGGHRNGRVAVRP